MHPCRPYAVCGKVAGVVASLVAFAAAHSQLIGIDYDTGTLYDISATTANVSVRALTTLNGAADLAYGPDGRHYAFSSGPNAEWYTLNINNGAKTSIGGMGLPFLFEGALTFDPNGLGYGTNVGEAENPQMFTINRMTGVSTIVGSIGFLPHDINGMVWRSDGKLAGIDRETNSFVVFTPDGNTVVTVRTYGAGEPLLGEVGGMCMYNGEAYFVTGGRDSAIPGNNSLYKVNLETGAPTLVGVLNGITGTGISGLTVVPEPTTIIALGASGLLLATRRRRR